MTDEFLLLTGSSALSVKDVQQHSGEVSSCADRRQEHADSRPGTERRLAAESWLETVKPSRSLKLSFLFQAVPREVQVTVQGSGLFSAH